MGDFIEERSVPIVLDVVDDSIGIEAFETTEGLPLAFCPLLWEDSGGGCVPERLPSVKDAVEAAGGSWPLGYCSTPECRDCPHLQERLEVTSLSAVWVCSGCAEALAPAIFPGYYTDGLCEFCEDEESIVLQLVLR